MEWRRTLLVVLYKRFPFIGARLLAAISSDEAVIGTKAMHACTGGGDNVEEERRGVKHQIFFKFLILKVGGGI